MGEHIYVEETLITDGYVDVLEALPTRDMREQPLAWLERCDAKMMTWLSVGHVTRDFAERAIGSAEHLAAELQRIPVMVGWCHREYVVAVKHRLDPADSSGRYKLASEFAFPNEGEDGAIERILLGLMS